jgi:uncharacterized protein YcfL
MRNIFLIVLPFMLFSCASSNHVKSNDASKVAKKNAETNGLICKREVIAGSRRHVKVCLTKEQRDFARIESQRAIRNATDGRAKSRPGQ